MNFIKDSLAIFFLIDIRVITIVLSGSEELRDLTFELLNIFHLGFTDHLFFILIENLDALEYVCFRLLQN